MKLLKLFLLILVLTLSLFHVITCNAASCNSIGTFAANEIATKRGASVSSVNVLACRTDSKQEFWNLDLKIGLTNPSSITCRNTIVWYRPFKEQPLELTKEGTCS